MEDYALNVTQTCLVDASFAREAFDGNEDIDLYDMAVPAWANLTGPSNTTAIYDQRLWASNWYNLFNDTTDARQYLTWQNPLQRAKRADPRLHDRVENLQFLFEHRKRLGGPTPAGLTQT